MIGALLTKYYSPCTLFFSNKAQILTLKIPKFGPFRHKTAHWRHNLAFRTHLRPILMVYMTEIVP